MRRQMAPCKPGRLPDLLRIDLQGLSVVGPGKETGCKGKKSTLFRPVVPARTALYKEATGWLFMLLRWEADHPVYAEFIGKHAEIVAPEGIFHGHCNLAAGGKTVEKTISFLMAVGVQ